MSTVSNLLSPFTLGNVELKNRIVISPMCQYSAEDGMANDWHLVHIGSRIVGGAALFIQEATAVSPNGRITHRDLGLWKDEQIAPLKRITDFVHSQGGKIGIQLAHAGRKASCEIPWLGERKLNPDEPNGWQTVGASPVPFNENDPIPHTLTKNEILEIVADFKAATQRAKTAGYDVIEVHAAHGYLLHDFYSPLSNTRTDEYGGSFENRIRLTLEVVEAVQEVWGKENALIVRISASDWTENGWNLDDSVKLAFELKKRGVHLIDTSSGGNIRARISLKPGYQVSFSSAIKNQVEIPTGAVGLITTPKQAEEILQNGDADLIFIGRESLRNPYFPFDAEKELLGEYENLPPQYARAFM